MPTHRLKLPLLLRLRGLIVPNALARDLLDALKPPDEQFIQYQNDPVGFGVEVLGETYTPNVQALMESVRDHPFTLARSGNATGKTHAAARIGVWFYRAFPGAQVFTAAAPPASNLEKLLWGEIGGIVEQHPNVFQGDEMRRLHIARGPQSFITGVTIPTSGTDAQREAKFSGKHAPYLLFILDEGDAIPDEVYRGIESCMSGGHARLLIMFNPRAESGAAYRMERDGRANVVELSALNHPNVTTGEDHIPGAVTRAVTVRRINEWCRPLAGSEEPDGESFELPGFLEGETAESQAGFEYPPLIPGFYKIIEPQFSYMVLGRYPSKGAAQLISREWISRARSRWDSYVSEHGEIPPSGTFGIMGLDVAELGQDSNAACSRFGGFVARMETWGGVDVLITGDRAADLAKRKNTRRVMVDATGVGAGVAPEIKRQGIPAFGVKVANKTTLTTDLGEFQLLRDELWWACREWLRTDPGAMLPPDEMLLEELITPTYEVENGRVRVMKKATMRELLKRSPDRADALTLTFFEPDLLFPRL